MNNLTLYLEQFVGDVQEPVRVSGKGFQNILDSLEKVGIFWDDEQNTFIYIEPITRPVSARLLGRLI